MTGKFTRNKDIAGDSRRDTFDFPPINKRKAYDIIDYLKKIAKDHDVSVARVALAWLLTKQGVTSIIIGAKKMDQLLDNIESTKLHLNDNELKELDTVSAIGEEYPEWMMNRQNYGRFPANV
jgi:aryl-alcohol dehydrogenase-like predicted oxidoreductase